MKKFALGFLGVFVFFYALSAFAGLDVPAGDPLTTLLQLIASFKAMSPIALASGIIMFTVQAFKSFAPGFKYIKVVVVFGGVVYAFLQSVISGLGLLEAAVFVFVSSGGAVLLYELFKNPLNTVFQVKS